MAAGSAKLVCFLLHGQEYAADIANVVETLPVRPVTRVFLTPAWLAGIMNLRGDVVAVLDLSRLLGMPPTVVTDESRILLTRHGGRRAGLLVDGLAELRDVSLERLERPPRHARARGRRAHPRGGHLARRQRGARPRPRGTVRVGSAGVSQRSEELMARFRFPMFLKFWIGCTLLATLLIVGGLIVS